MRVGSVVVVLSCLVLFGSTARADWISIQKDYELYGHVSNVDNCCAPTATINSFRYLENKYPHIYDTKLTKGNIVQSRDLLANGWDERVGMGCPSSYKSWWEHKVWWIEDNAPNTTVFKGIVNKNPAGWHRAEDLAQGLPTWAWLWEELGKCEDVEIGIQWGTDLGHALTLTSLKFDDTNGNQQWDAGEARKIDYLDPNDPSHLTETNLTEGASGQLEFTWGTQLVWIDLAYSESPVPEPGVLVILGAGSLTLLLRRRRA